MRIAAGAALALALISGGSAHADEIQLPPAHYPSLQIVASNVAAFVPVGWAIESRQTGDLNGDGADDIVLVLRGQDPALVLANTQGLGEDHIDSNPRILAVLFADPGGVYHLAMDDHLLIPRMSNPVLSDYLEDGGVVVAGGVMRVTLGLFYSAGTWETSSMVFTFRWQHGRFELIGYDHRTMLRNSGDADEMSLNYSTGAVELIHTNDMAETTPRTRRTHVRRPILAIDQVGDGIAFDPHVQVGAP
jgi:hypothetical protein